MNNAEGVVNQVLQDPSAPAAATAAVVEPSFLQAAAQFMQEGGVFMYFILGIWLFGVAIALERIAKLYRYDINGESLLNEIKKNILENNLAAAIGLCSNSKAPLPSVLKNALKRANQSREQIQDAVDASVLEVVPKVERRLNYLALVANISTLIGLLGTIYGLIDSFAAVAGADPAEKAKLLAMGISKAMNTTAFGLISAITIMVIHTILTSKSDKILGDVDEFSMKLIDLIGTKKEVPRSASNTAPSIPSNVAA